MPAVPRAVRAVHPTVHPPAGAGPRRDPQADAFARTGSVTLQRLHDGGPLVYLEPGGLPEATVMEEHVEMRLAERADALLAGESLRRLDQRHTCVTLDGAPLFSVERYRAVTQAAFTVADADGAPLAIYLPGDAERREVELRDGTGAPVAAMRREHGRFNVDPSSRNSGGRTTTSVASSTIAGASRCSRSRAC
ncbi:MAG: hypothetical protein E6G17_01930 [Actinobacteria bacterium]|nr:MAG: hypothetical protein E6G17_01930 [Actinomycetota bacterium]